MKPLLTAPHEETGRRGALEHKDYLIDRFRVAYEFGGGWKCPCADFAKSDACRHTREAAGRRAAQMRISEHIRMGSPAALVFSGHVSRTPTPQRRRLDRDPLTK